MQYKSGTFTPFFECRGVLQGGSYNQRQVPVAASQTIRKGDILKLTAGTATVNDRFTVEQFITAPTASNYTVTANAGVYGIALESITTNSSGVEAATNKSSINVAVFDGNLEIAIRVLGVSATGSTAVSGLGASSEIQDLVRGTAYAIGRYTDADSKSWYFLSVNSTNGQLRFQEGYPAAAVTDAFGVVWAQCVPGFRQGG